MYEIDWGPVCVWMHCLLSGGGGDDALSVAGDAAAHSESHLSSANHDAVFYQQPGMRSREHGEEGWRNGYKLDDKTIIK